MLAQVECDQDNTAYVGTRASNTMSTSSGSQAGPMRWAHDGRSPTSATRTTRVSTTETGFSAYVALSDKLKEYG